MKMIRNSKIVILTEVPFGEGNLLNLMAIRDALKEGIKVIVINKTPIQERDYTKDKATEIFEDLKRNGASFVKDEKEAISLIKEGKGSGLNI